MLAVLLLYRHDVYEFALGMSGRSVKGRKLLYDTSGNGAKDDDQPRCHFPKDK